MARGIGFVTALGGKKDVRDSYGRMLVALLRSMVARLPGLSAPVIVMHATLTPAEKKRIKAAYEYVEFRKVNAAMYRKHKKLVPSYWLLEVFNPALDLEKAVVLGADMLCVGRTDGLLYPDHGPIACWWEEARKCWNTGCMVVRKPVISEENYTKAIACQTGHAFGSDQAVVNKLFGKEITALPTAVQRFVDEKSEVEGVMFLHFIHKPFASGGKKKNSPACIVELKKHLKELWWS